MRKCHIKQIIIQLVTNYGDDFSVNRSKSNNQISLTSVEIHTFFLVIYSRNSLRANSIKIKQTGEKRGRTWNNGPTIQMRLVLFHHVLFCLHDSVCIFLGEIYVLINSCVFLSSHWSFCKTKENQQQNEEKKNRSSKDTICFIWCVYFVNGVMKLNTKHCFHCWPNFGMISVCAKEAGERWNKKNQTRNQNTNKIPR